MVVCLRAPVVCGGLRLTKDGTYATRGARPQGQADAFLFPEAPKQRSRIVELDRQYPLRTAILSYIRSGRSRRLDPRQAPGGDCAPKCPVGARSVGSRGILCYIGAQPSVTLASSVRQVQSTAHLNTCPVGQANRPGIGLNLHLADRGGQSDGRLGPNAS